MQESQSAAKKDAAQAAFERWVVDKGILDRAWEVSGVCVRFDCFFVVLINVEGTGCRGGRMLVSILHIRLILRDPTS